jgi:hypothetical protein
VFIWFIAATPVDALIALGVPERLSVLPPLLDTAIQISEANGLAGRIGLHAAEGPSAKENTILENKYRFQGLRQRSKIQRFFRFPFRRDDGRLFYFTAEDAQKYAALQDDLR